MKIKNNFYFSILKKIFQTIIHWKMIFYKIKKNVWDRKKNI